MKEKIERRSLLWIGLIVSILVLLFIPIRAFTFLGERNLSSVLKTIIIIISIITPFCFIVFFNRRLNPPKYNYKQASETLKEIEEKSNKTIFQELQELFRNNKYLSKALNHLVLISIVLGITGLFTNETLFGVWALLFSIIAMIGKQKYAIFGYIFAIIVTIGSTELTTERIIGGILFAIFGTIYNLYKNSQLRRGK